MGLKKYKNREYRTGNKLCYVYLLKSTEVSRTTGNNTMDNSHIPRRVAFVAK